MKNQQNIELKKQIKDANLFLWQVANEMKIHESTLYRILRHELSDLQRERNLNVIEKLKDKY